MTPRRHPPQFPPHSDCASLILFRQEGVSAWVTRRRLICLICLIVAGRLNVRHETAGRFQERHQGRTADLARSENDDGSLRRLELHGWMGRFTSHPPLVILAGAAGSAAGAIRRISRIASPCRLSSVALSRWLSWCSVPWPTSEGPSSERAGLSRYEKITRASGCRSRRNNKSVCRSLFPVFRSTNRFVVYTCGSTSLWPLDDI